MRRSTLGLTFLALLGCSMVAAFLALAGSTAAVAPLEFTERTTTDCDLAQELACRGLEKPMCFCGSSVNFGYVDRFILKTTSISAECQYELGCFGSVMCGCGYGVIV